MEITQEMKEKMLLSLLRHDRTPSGVECSFFQFGSVGVKFYGYGENACERASNAFERQTRCYLQGLAPRPGRTFAISLKGAGCHKGHDLVLYGYTTECAIVVPTPDEDDVSKLYAALDAAGLPSGDLHYANIGYVVDEETESFKLVPIDFGWHFEE